MAKLNSLSGLVYYVKDPLNTADFYEKLGFVVTKRETNQASLRLNWFFLDFHAQDKEDNPEFKKEAQSDKKGAGLYIYVSVDDVDEYYKSILAKGFKPSSEPRDWPWGNREFALRDPDGYKLIFFKKLK